MQNDNVRHSRHIILPEIGQEGLEKLSITSVVIVGLGGLGSPALAYLGTCGIKNFTLVDFDIVELHNLPRQIIHTEEYIGKFKTESAKNFISKIDSSVKIATFNEKLKNENISKIAENANIILDCTDDLETRYLLSKYAKKTRKSIIMASVLKFAGQVLVFPDGISCYSCVFPEFKVYTESCASSGVLNSVCGIIGTLQATEAIKLILKDCKLPFMIFYDAMNLQFRRINLRKCFEACKIVKATPKTCNSTKLITWQEYFLNPEKYFLVDLRNKADFDYSHIKNCINVPAELIEEYKFETDKVIVLVCKRGISAQKVQIKLGREGVLVMDGGLTEYKDVIDNTFPLL